MSRIAALFMLAFALIAAPAAAKISFDVSDTDIARVELVADRMTTAPGDEVRIILRIMPQQGWHSYWVNPGGPGAATTIDWEGPDGVAFSPILWPAPERLVYGPFVNFGHSGETLLTTVMRVPEDWPAGAPIELTARAAWLLCSDVCIGEQTDFRLTLPTADTPEEDWEFVALAAQASATRPVEIGAASAYAFDAGAIRLSTPWAAIEEAAALEGAGAIVDAFFYPEAQGLVEAAAPQSFVRAGDALQLDLTRMSEESFGGRSTLEGDMTGVLELAFDSGETAALRLTAVGDVEDPNVAVAPLASAGDAAAGSGGGGQAAAATGAGVASISTGLPQSLWMAALFAFLGGLILNVMPCVFPVLALKAMSFAEGAGQPRRERMAHAGAYSAGVLISFLVIAVLLVAFKSASDGAVWAWLRDGVGAAIGLFGFELGQESLRWGFHMQSPWVVGLLAMIMVVIGLNFSGVFEFSGRFAGVGSGLAGRSGHRGAFFTGVLAVVVASPCTAPFMIGAVGYALVQDAATAFVVFTALGLGFAAPLAVLGVAPGLAARLPKPGPWMARMRALLAFPMYATAAYLLWVLGGVAGRNAVFAGMIGAVLIAAALWAVGSGAPSSRRGRRIAGAAAVVCVVMAVFALRAGIGLDRDLGALEAGAASAPIAEGAPTPFAADAIDVARADGRTVFVYVTADWCVSCKFNELRVLSTDVIAAAIDTRNVLYMEADWTRFDPEITAYLDRYQHPGAPLYVVYRDGGPGVVLPQLLTESIVLEALGPRG